MIEFWLSHAQKLRSIEEGAKVTLERDEILEELTEFN